MTRPSAALFNANLRMLALTAPELKKAIERAQLQPTLAPVLKKGKIVNLESGGIGLYDNDAPQQTQKELEDYFARSPIRASDTSLASTSRTHDPQDFTGRWQREVKACVLKSCRAFKGRGLGLRRHASLLIVFGMGLGYHIDALFKRLRFCSLCIVETSLDSFVASARIHSFSKWHRRCVARGGKLQLCFGENLQDLEEKLGQFFAQEMHFFVNGFYIYRHLKNQATLDRLEQRLENLYWTANINNGYYEDQKTMFANSVANLSTSEDMNLLVPQLAGSVSREAVIVGNGPSLDAESEVLASLCQGRAVFSCGSTLFTLLKKGLRPDYHCEIENTPTTLLHIEQACRMESLSQTTLLATASVDPRLPRHFSSPIFFLRSNTPLACLCEGLYRSGGDMSPTVANTAFTSANHLGFKTLYLLGVDVGFKGTRSHHAREAVHFLDEERNKAEQNRQKYEVVASMRGNLGGLVSTTLVFMTTKLYLEKTARRYALNRFYNCSDGLRIEGFVPLVSCQVPRLESDPQIQQAEKDRLAARCPKFRLGDQRLMQRLRTAQDALKTMEDKIQDVFKRGLQAERLKQVALFHKELTEVFATARHQSAEAVIAWKFLESFLHGTLFIFFNAFYRAFLNLQGEGWRETRKCLQGKREALLSGMMKDLADHLADHYTTLEDCWQRASFKKDSAPDSTQDSPPSPLPPPA